MTKIDIIKTAFPDNFGIKDMLRNNKTQNSKFLDLTLRSYTILTHLKSQELVITESLKTNQNINIFDHQILAAQKIKNKFGGTAMLADEVGLGKTIEAGIIIKEFLITGLAKKILILAPPSLLSQWQDELLNKFDLSFTNYQDDSKFHSIQSHNLLLMSHSAAIYPKQSDQLNSIYWDLVIVDEAHSMKNANTNKHNLVQKLSKRNLLLLTATPLQNNLEELYNLIDLLRPGYLGTWKQFKEKYVGDNQNRKINPARRNELQQILSDIIIRTTRNEVRKYIKFTDRIPYTKILTPANDESTLYAEITKIIQNMYMTSTNTITLMIYQRLASSSTNASKRALYKMKSNNVISKERYDELMSVANGIKLDSKLLNLFDILKNDNRSKFLIFTEFHATQDYIAENLEKIGYQITLFNGKMTPEERRESISRFKNDVQIMISTSAGGEGQNFQFCHNIVNYDLPWNPMRVEQRIGRVHRIGQKNNVFIFNFALYGTIEAYILELLYTKINLFKMALGDMDLLFEDSWSGGSSNTWFKEYMSASNEKERQNKFTALGNQWIDRKDVINNAINNFNTDVFKNFNLSTIGENQNES